MADAPNQLIAELIGEAFIDAVRRSRSHSAERLRAAWRWLSSAANAPPGMRLVSPDGYSYTGIVVVEKSHAVLLIALCHPGAPRTSLDLHDDRFVRSWYGTQPDDSEHLPFDEG